MIEEIRQTTAIVVEEYQKMRRVFSSESTKKLVGWNLALNKKKEADVGILVVANLNVHWYMIEKINLLINIDIIVPTSYEPTIINRIESYS